ncbi:hypothetical protein ACSHMG_23095, partial [Bacillus [licheniformis] CMCC 63516]|uniref:hypothetical protein n=3 Tax=Bacillaceae TaxID=186817 RepID=UPI003EE522AE
TYRDYLNQMKKLYTDLMENGYKLHEIDEMDIHRFFELADFKYEEENKLVPAYRIFGVTL